MAVYLFTVKVISRGRDGGNMLAAAAYRAGSRLVEQAEWDPGSAVAHAAHAAGAELADTATGRAWDFSRKLVEFSEVSLPDRAPGWMADRQSLWSAVEASEKRCDVRLGREIILGLPRELGRDEQIALVRDFVAEHVTSRGMVCDWSLHEPTASDGKPQPHCHLLTTTRAIDPDKPTGFGKKMRELDRRDLIVSWRQGWEQSANHALEMAGREERIDGRSIAARLEAALEAGDF